MDMLLQPSVLRGVLSAPPSKSMAHRLLICAALADNPTQLNCPQFGQDILATCTCLQAMGAKIIQTDSGFIIQPIATLPKTAVLPCKESGTTLRLLLPIVGALGIDATFTMEGRLPQRPLSPLWEEMERMGCFLTRPTAQTIRCTGKLQAGKYQIDGSISSQFISGLLFATSLLPGSEVEISGNITSAPYIAMTRQVMEQFHAPKYHSPSEITVEGDWSNAAFWLAASHLGNPIHITNLDFDSLQGDRTIAELLPQLNHHTIISAKNIPDLIPILSVVAAAGHGAVFTDIDRLRLKESDRVTAIVQMLHALGGKAEADAHSLTLYGTGLVGGVVNSHMDHRIAMAAAIASTVCKDPVTILHAECVKKSYPSFWDDFQSLGGNLCKLPMETT